MSDFNPSTFASQQFVEGIRSERFAEERNTAPMIAQVGSNIASALHQRQQVRMQDAQMQMGMAVHGAEMMQRQRELQLREAQTASQLVTWQQEQQLNAYKIKMMQAIDAADASQLQLDQQREAVRAMRLQNDMAEFNNSRAMRNPMTPQDEVLGQLASRGVDLQQFGFQLTAAPNGMLNWQYNPKLAEAMLKRSEETASAKAARERAEAVEAMAKASVAESQILRNEAEARLAEMRASKPQEEEARNLSMDLERMSRVQARLVKRLDDSYGLLSEEEERDLRNQITELGDIMSRMGRRLSGSWTEGLANPGRTTPPPSGDQPEPAQPQGDAQPDGEAVAPAPQGPPKPLPIRIDHEQVKRTSALIDADPAWQSEPWLASLAANAETKNRVSMAIAYLGQGFYMNGMSVPEESLPATMFSLAKKQPYLLALAMLTTKGARGGYDEKAVADYLLREGLVKPSEIESVMADAIRERDYLLGGN